MLSPEEREKMKTELAQLKLEQESAQKTIQPQQRREPILKSNAGKYIGLGLEFAITLAVFIFGGYWLDTKLMTSPWLLLLCLCLGFAIAIFRLVRVAQNLEKE